MFKNCKSKESWMLNKSCNTIRQLTNLPILPLLVILLCDRDVCYNFFTSFESDLENVMRGLYIKSAI